MRLERCPGFPGVGEPGIFWLGQAGFWIETGAHRVLIDPYLSDSLARKYAGRKHPHKRMMPPPLTVSQLPRPDIVLVTHAHSDHLDPDTLKPLFQRFPELPLVIPAAHESLARERIGTKARQFTVDAGEVFTPLEGLTLSAFPAAHEELRLDQQGRHCFLGYGIEFGIARIYHSGDCVPFEALPALVASYAPDIALLPVNGRDPQRREDGIPGNFTLSEAISLAADCPFLVPHHFGMFDFNTIDPQQIDAAAEAHGTPRILRPMVDTYLRIVTQ